MKNAPRNKKDVYHRQIRVWGLTDYIYVEVELRIDTKYLVEQLGARAFKNRSGKSRVMSGAVECIVTGKL